jgi:hypothetical protein
MGQRPPLQANRPKIPILPGGNHILIPWRPDVPNVLPVSKIHMAWHAGWCGAGWTSLPSDVQSVCERHTHTFPQYADDTALVATSRSPSLLVGYLERRLRDWRIVINVSKSTPVLSVRAAICIQKPRPLQFSRRASALCRKSTVSSGDTWYSACLVDARQLGGKEGTSKIGRALPNPNQNKRPVPQKRCAALQAAHPSYDGLWMYDLEVRCP